MPPRGVGTTTNQLREAPFAAIYIFAGDRSYYDALLTLLDRRDIVLVRDNEASYEPWRGTSRPIVIDHWVFLNSGILLKIVSHNNRLERDDIFVVKVQVNRQDCFVYQEGKRGMWQGHQPTLAEKVMKSKTALKVGKTLAKQYYWAQMIGTEYHILGEAPWQEW